MRRRHLFELEDQPWFPALLRDAGTAYLSRVFEITGMIHCVAPHLTRLLEHTDERRIVDLCSGAGAPARAVFESLRASGLDVTLCCTDLFPHAAALARAAEGTDGALSFEPGPIDATAVPARLEGIRTVFNAFHHFPPALARRVLEDAVRRGQPIAIFEFVGRQPSMLLSLIGLPLVVMALLPTLRPFRIAWIPWTYLIPIIPAFVLWDGFVSCLRVYAPDELDALTEGLDAYAWESGRFDLPGPGQGTYLVGTPIRPDQR